MVDDLQWLDQESIDVLAFVARRVDSGGVGMIMAQRSDAAISAFDQLPSLQVAGLTRSDALTLLRRVVTRPLEARISDQIVTAAHGNPLAIVDLAQELSTHQLDPAARTDARRQPSTGPLPPPATGAAGGCADLAAAGRR